MGVNGEAMQLHTAYKSCILTQVTRESVSVLQVMQDPYQVLQVKCAASERVMKPKVHMIKSLSP